MCDHTNGSSETTMHPWQRYGLGMAPFVCVGVTEKVYRATPDSPAQPGGTCDACGMGIRYLYEIRSADGKTFHVGSDCVMKTQRRDNAKRDPLIVKVNDLRRKIERDARHAREAVRIKAGRALYEANREFFATFPHPSEWRREQGETLADCFDWYFCHAGNKGQLDTIKAVERKLAERDAAAAVPAN